MNRVLRRGAAIARDRSRFGRWVVCLALADEHLAALRVEALTR